MRSTSTASAVSSFVVGVRTTLPRPRAGEVRPALRAVAVDDHARDLEDHALEGGGADDLGPRRVLGRRLRRILIVDLRPGEVEQPLAQQAGDDAQEDADRLVNQLHEGRRYPFRRPGQSVLAYS